MTRLLVLFAGTKALRPEWEVISLGSEKSTPTIVADILQWGWTVFEPGFFDHIHASPLCTDRSRCKTVGVRNLEAC